MKKMSLVMLVGILVIGTVTSAFAGPFTRREARQQVRIYQGVDNGSITPGEFMRLEAEQGRIDSHRQQAWSDGVMTPREAGRLTREQNRASRHIWRAKHNYFSHLKTFVYSYKSCSYKSCYNITFLV